MENYSTTSIASIPFSRCPDLPQIGSFEKGLKKGSGVDSETAIPHPNQSPDRQGAGDAPVFYSLSKRKRADLSPSRSPSDFECPSVTQRAGPSSAPVDADQQHRETTNRDGPSADHTSVPLHDDPHPAVQPKQCSPVTMRRATNSSGSKSRTWLRTPDAGIDNAKL